MTSPQGRTPLLGEEGLSMIELLIVLVVVAVGILALSGVQTSSSKNVYSTGRRTRAIAVAETQMEVTRGMGYAGAVAGSGTMDGFAYQTNVDSVDVELHRVTVTVNWTGDQGAADSVRLVNLISNR